MAGDISRKRDTPPVSDWHAYYEAAGEDPRSTLVAAADSFAEPGRAVDLGCGTGRDTFELLRRGWSVLAVDGQQEAIDRLLAAAPAGASLEARVARLEDATWPECDLVNSSYALPFVPPQAFAAVWARIVDSLRAGGRFSGQLFGERDEWRTDPRLTFQTRADVARLFAPFDLEQLDEVEDDGKTATGAAKHWHLFHIVARKR
jgi:SAM-dependent methyltransferase